jgi:hypothetical protein
MFFSVLLNYWFLQVWLYLLHVGVSVPSRCTVTVPTVLGVAVPHR